MELDDATCYRALTARDRRFDGVFFVGVATTGVYCRPICPARTPRADRCTYFARPAEAEQAGFRACFRCRPEVAPGRADVVAIPRLVRRALALIDAGAMNEGSADALAERLGVTSRHLRRALTDELGVTPVELAQTRRLALAKQLLQDSALPLVDVAFAAGFASVRRFNALFRARFGRPPSEVRRQHADGDGATAAVLPLRLDYRPPLDWDALLAFLAARALPGLETIEPAAAGEPGVYRRVVTIGDVSGAITVRPDPARPALRAELDLALARHAMPIAARLRRLFDLDAQPDHVRDVLAADPMMAPRVARRPGLRVPGAFDGFEMAVRAVLGQQVSVRAATTFAARLVARFGPPRADAMAALSVDELRGIGLTGARAATLLGLARAVASGAIDLEAADPEAVVAALEALPGIGPWTAQYIAMRAVHWPDAFPAGDLGVRKALGMPPPREVLALAEAWRPWRAYAVMHLWSDL
ncbi:MAG: AlkA N-terminal domain-containing protein [Myxococcota bacterium]